MPCHSDILYRLKEGDTEEHKGLFLPSYSMCKTPMNSNFPPVFKLKI